MSSAAILPVNMASKGVHAEKDIYKVDDSTGRTIFIFPKDLVIAWVDDKRYWEWFWILLESHDYKVVEIPRLRRVCWLDMRGRYDMADLTCGAEYVIAFDVMMTDAAAGWDHALVTLGLELPNNGTSSSRTTDISNMPRNTWTMLRVGDFVATAAQGYVKFWLTEIDAGTWKSGLIVKAAVIHRTFK